MRLLINIYQYLAIERRDRVSDYRVTYGSDRRSVYRQSFFLLSIRLYNRHWEINLVPKALFTGVMHFQFSRE